MHKKQPKRGKRVRVGVYLEPEQKEALEALSTRTRVKVAEYVREGIDAVLKKYSTKSNTTSS